MNRDGTALVRIRKEIELELRALHRVVEEYKAIPGSFLDWMRSLV